MENIVQYLKIYFVVSFFRVLCILYIGTVETLYSDSKIGLYFSWIIEKKEDLDTSLKEMRRESYSFRLPTFYKTSFYISHFDGL